MQNYKERIKTEKKSPGGQAPLCKEDSPIRGNVVEDDKRVAKLAAKLTEGWKTKPPLPKGRGTAFGGGGIP